MGNTVHRQCSLELAPLIKLVRTQEKPLENASLIRCDSNVQRIKLNVEVVKVL